MASMKMLVGIAMSASISALCFSMIGVIVMFNDLNTLYDDVMDEMGDFKVSLTCTAFHILTLLIWTSYSRVTILESFMHTSDEPNPLKWLSTDSVLMDVRKTLRNVNSVPTSSS
uniref:Col_cuticle_N domain-containing protein n=1 Tax=Ascaris lumbricoides TaxID=6252 RepID=A0A0M3I842_ASCLU